MIRLTSLLLCLLLVLPVAARAQEDSLIAAYRTDLTALREAAATAPSLGEVRGRLSRAFIDADIAFSRRYLDNWSQLLLDRWAQHDVFFATQLELLTNWDHALITGAATRAEAQAALDPAMDQMRLIAGHMPAWLDDDTDRMADRAFWTDLAQEIGCCDPLYYQALAEADSVWGVALSPDPSAIAALQIVPDVALGDVPTETAAERAYAWLASRAAGLAADGAASPARRRALLIEARLLEDLFGLPGDLELERNLTTLVIREGFAAQPVAPLIRMAGLTEAGPLRQMLLEHAAARLDSRASHLRPAVPSDDALATRSMTADTPTRQMGGTEAEVSSSDPAAPGFAPAAPSPAPAAPGAVPTVMLPEPANDPDAEAATLVDEALAALLRAGPGDAALFIGIADMAARADALIGSGTSLDLVESLSVEPPR